MTEEEIRRAAEAEERAAAFRVDIGTDEIQTREDADRVVERLLASARDE